MWKIPTFLKYIVSISNLFNYSSLSDNSINIIKMKHLALMRSKSIVR
jgi:hypothetical protein